MKLWVQTMEHEFYSERMAYVRGSHWDPQLQLMDYL